MEYKDLLLSKLYDDNTICYWINAKLICIKNKESNHIADWNLNHDWFWLSNDKIWKFFETKTGDNYQEIEDLTSSILEDHLKRKGLITFY